MGLLSLVPSLSWLQFLIALDTKIGAGKGLGSSLIWLPLSYTLKFGEHVNLMSSHFSLQALSSQGAAVAEEGPSRGAKVHR